MLDEYRGHLVLDAVKQADLVRLKKHLTTETVNFKHPYTGEMPLVHITSSDSSVYTTELFKCDV